MNPIIFLLAFVSFESILARGPPILLPHTPNVITIEINENEPLELHCPVTVSPDLSVQWSKNNEELDPMWSASNILIRRFLLKIHRASSTDAGLYKCNVVNGFGNVQAQFHVIIKFNGTSVNKIVTDEQPNLDNWDVDSINGEAPVFLSRNNGNSPEPTRVIQPEGTTVQFKCLATGKPTPEVRWKKDGKILSEDEYGITQSQILNIKDLRRTDMGNFTCEVFNSFGTINASYILVVTEKLHFFGQDPQNMSVQIAQPAVLHCRVQTNDPTVKIQWLKKVDTRNVFRPDVIVLNSEQYETIEQSPIEHYPNSILSKTLLFPRVNQEQNGEYICLIQNDKATNYKKAFIHIVDAQKGVSTSMNNNHNTNNLILITILPLLVLGLLLFSICCFRQYHRQTPDHSHYKDNMKSPMKAPQQQQPLIQYHGPMVPSIASRTSNDYLADSVDSIPVSRQYQPQRYGPSGSSDLASLTSSNLYYARIQAI